MAALTSGRNTQSRGPLVLRSYGVEASTVIYVGSMVALDDSGYAVPAQAKTGSGTLTKVPLIKGVMDHVYSGDVGGDAHNVAGYPQIPSPSNLGSAGAIRVAVGRGIYAFDNDDSITQPGGLCFAQDDHTVGTSDGSGTTAVSAEAHTLPASGPLIAQLTHGPGVTDVVVQNSSGSTTYVEGTDYEVVIDPNTGNASILGMGATLVASFVIHVNYSYESTAPTKPVAGEVVAVDPSGQVWVDFTEQASPAV